MKFLDIDMDFFLNKIAYEKCDDKRLSSEDYIPWKEEQFRLFLQEKCKLDKKDKILGRIVTNHVEAFCFWKKMMGNNEIEIPFEVTHIDAHTDLKAGYPNQALKYIYEDLLHIPINERLTRLDTGEMGSANYLSYAIACGFFNKVDLVMHPDFNYDVDLPTGFFKDHDYKSNYLQLKGYKSALNQDVEAVTVDTEIPFEIIKGNEFMAESNYDYLIFCQSPGYTPKTADYMLHVIKEFIIEI